MQNMQTPPGGQQPPAKQSFDDLLREAGVKEPPAKAAAPATTAVPQGGGKQSFEDLLREAGLVPKEQAKAAGAMAPAAGQSDIEKMRAKVATTPQEPVEEAPAYDSRMYTGIGLPDEARGRMLPRHNVLPAAQALENGELRGKYGLGILNTEQYRELYNKQQQLLGFHTNPAFWPEEYRSKEGQERRNRELQDIQTKLRRNDELRKVDVSLNIADPKADLYHHSRVLQRVADKDFGGDAGKMFRTLEQSQLGSYLSEPEQEQYKQIAAMQILDSRFQKQLAAGNRAGAEQTAKEIETYTKEYQKLLAQRDTQIQQRIQQLHEDFSNDPDDDRLRELKALQGARALMFPKQREREQAVVQLILGDAQPDAFKGMSPRDIARVLLHTTRLKYDKAAAGPLGPMSDEARDLKAKIGILAPVVLLNQSPIDKVDDGFFSTALKTFKQEMSPTGAQMGTEQNKAITLSKQLADIGVVQAVSPEAAGGLKEASQEFKHYSAEDFGSQTGTSVALMGKLIPSMMLTEGVAGMTKIPALVRAVQIASKGGRVGRSEALLTRALYEMTKEGVAYKAADTLFPGTEDSQLSFLVGFMGKGVSMPLEAGLSKVGGLVASVFGSKAPQAMAIIQRHGQNLASPTARMTAQGLVETGEEFGNELGDVLEKTDSYKGMVEDLKQRFPTVDDAIHFAVVSFVMGAVMGSGTEVGRALMNRSDRAYRSMSREERDQFDKMKAQFDAEMEAVNNEAVKQEAAEQKKQEAAGTQQAPAQQQEVEPFVDQTADGTNAPAQQQQDGTGIDAGATPQAAGEEDGQPAVQAGGEPDQQPQGQGTEVAAGGGTVADAQLAADAGQVGAGDEGLPVPAGGPQGEDNAPDSDVPDDLIENSEPVGTRDNADKLWSDGVPLYTVSEQDGEITRITSFEQLNNTTPDGIYTYTGGQKAATEEDPKAQQKKREAFIQTLVEATGSNSQGEKPAGGVLSNNEGVAITTTDAGDSWVIRMYDTDAEKLVTKQSFPKDKFSLKDVQKKARAFQEGKETLAKSAEEEKGAAPEWDKLIEMSSGSRDQFKKVLKEAYGSDSDLSKARVEKEDTNPAGLRIGDIVSVKPSKSKFTDTEIKGTEQGIVLEVEATKGTNYPSGFIARVVEPGGAAVWYDLGLVTKQGKQEAPATPATPAPGDRVKWTSNGKELTGTVRSIMSNGKVSVDTDQIALAGGVPIGRIETVSPGRLTVTEAAQKEEEEAQEEEEAPPARSAEEIVEEYEAEQREWVGESNVESVINTLLAGNVSSVSWARWGDTNNNNSAIAKTYLRKGGRALDDIAQEASGISGVEVTPQELVDHMLAFPNGRPTTSPRMRKLQEEYTAATGKKLDMNVVNAKANAKAANLLSTKRMEAFNDSQVQDVLNRFVDDNGNINWQAVIDEIDINEGALFTGFPAMASAEKLQEIRSHAEQQLEKPADAKGDEGVQESPAVESSPEQSSERKAAEAEWQQEQQRREEALTKAKGERDRFLKDWNKRGQALFGEDEGSKAPGMFDGDTRQNDATDFRSLVEPLNAAVDKAQNEADRWMKDRGQTIERRVKERAAQTRVDAPAPKKPSKLSHLSEDEQKRADELNAALKARLKQMRGGALSMAALPPVDPEFIAMGVEYAALIIKNGARGFAAYAKAMTEAIGEEIKPYLKELYMGAKFRSGMNTEGMSTEAEVSAADVDAVTNEPIDEDEQRGSDVPTGEQRGDAPVVDDGQQPGGGEEAVPGGDAAGLSGAELPSVSGDVGTPEQEAGRGPGQDGGGTDGAVTGGRDAAEGGQPAVTTGAQGDTARNDGPVTPAQPADPNAKNHVLPKDREWIEKGPKTRARANLDAVALLNTLEKEDRNATPEEKEVLAKYVGWGGLREVFEPQYAQYIDAQEYDIPHWIRSQALNWRNEWGELHKRLKDEMTKEEWTSALQSTEYAHYSSRDVINAMWKAVVRLGFRGGKALEPAVGIGNFIGLIPDAIRDLTAWRAGDVDSLSARLAAKLYPEARIGRDDFTTTKLAPNSYDLVITNAPFSRDIQNDGRFPLSLNLHNYFIARSLDAVKPGGIVAIITSSRTMDTAPQRDARAFFAKNAEMVGAIRLPNSAFAKNAGTTVTTDILFFRKNDATPFVGERFENVTEYTTADGQKVQVNEYFANHPDMVLGQYVPDTKYDGRGKKDPENSIMAVAPVGDDLAGDLANAIDKLPNSVMGSDAAQQDVRAAKKIKAGTKAGMLVFEGDTYVVIGSDGHMVDVEWAKDKKKVAQAHAYVAVRDAQTDLLDAMNSNAPEAEVAKGRAALNKAYDAYVKKYGILNERKKDTKSTYLKDDIMFPRVMALEDEHVAKVVKNGKESRTLTYSKGDIFSQRTIHRAEPPKTADTAGDAVTNSINWKGGVDVPYIASMLGMSEEAAEAELRLKGLAFKDPASGMWQSRAVYLSGFTKQKLEEAKVAAKESDEYASNMEELEKVQPERVKIENVTFRIGADWVPTSVYADFMKEEMGLRSEFKKIKSISRITVSHSANTENFKNEGKWGVPYSEDVAQGTAWYGHEIFDALLELKPLEVTYSYKSDGERITIKDEKATFNLKEKAKEMQEAFKRFVLSDAKRTELVEDAYNESKNIAVKANHNTSTLESYPGAVDTIINDKGKAEPLRLKLHQKFAVARGLVESYILAHAVGVGKTYTLITTAMEMRRLGIAKKPMIVAQNSTVAQIADDFIKLYPNAKVLVPPKADNMTPLERQTFMSRIAMGDWDAVIVPQSFIINLQNDPERVRQFIQQQLDELMAVKAESTGDRAATKDIAKAITALQKRLKDALDDSKKDSAMTFEQLGVDALFVDEAHEFKKLQFATRRSNIKGLDKSFSKRGMDMLLKVRWIQQNNRGGNVIFATGTPVSNTIAELWTMIRFTQPKTLELFGIDRFDNFDASFTKDETGLERTGSGKWKMVTRFAKYTNGRELIRLWHMAADVVTADMAKVPRPPLKGGSPSLKVIRPSLLQQDFSTHLLETYKTWENMKGEEKKKYTAIPLVVMGKARASSLDMRMVHVGAEDDPSSKLNKAAEFMYEKYKELDSVKGTQMAFSDLYQFEVNKVVIFNAHHALRNKLIELGIPANEVVVVTDTDKKERQKVFDKMKTGEVRIAIGTTGKMGTGVNVQDKLAVLHNLDAPWRPMDFEQRNGRIWRQGNKLYDDHGIEPEIINWAVSSTLDTTLFQVVAIKAKTQAQVLSGEIAETEFEDGNEMMTLTYEQQSAATSGDTRVMDKVMLEAEVRQLNALRDAHYRESRNAQNEAARLQVVLPKMEANRADVAAMHQRFSSLFPKGGAVSVEIPKGGLYDGAKLEGEAGITALNEHFKKLKEDGEYRAALETTPGERIYDVGGFRVNGQDVKVGAVVHVVRNLQNMRVEFDPTMTDLIWQWGAAGGQFGGASQTASGFLNMSLPASIKKMQDRVTTYDEEISQHKKDLVQYAGFQSRPFEREIEIEEKQQKLAKIKAELEEEGKNKGPEEPYNNPHGFRSLFVSNKDAAEMIAADLDSEEDEDTDEDGGDDDGGGSGTGGGGTVTSSYGAGPKSSGQNKKKRAYGLSEGELLQMVRQQFGRVNITNPADPFAFADYAEFKRWMDGRYQARDIDGMRTAFAAQPDWWKVKYIARTRNNEHERQFVDHIVIGAPLPLVDGPKPVSGPPPMPPKQATPPPPAGPARKGSPSSRAAFDTMALIQFARKFNVFPEVNERLTRALGKHILNTGTGEAKIQTMKRLFWDQDLGAEVLAHEIGHFIDLAISLDGMKLSIGRKLRPLERMKRRITNGPELKAQAKALSAEWRGPFDKGDKYRNSADELFADFFSAMLNSPELVNQKYPLLHDTFQDLLDTKPEFKLAYDDLTNMLAGGGLADAFRDQVKGAVEETHKQLTTPDPKKKLNPWEAGIRTFANMWYRARQIEGHEKVIGDAISEELEYSRSWAFTQNTLFEDEFKKKVVPELLKVAPDPTEARAEVNIYAQAVRTIDERRAAGKWIEQNPDEARDVLAKIAAQDDGTMTGAGSAMKKYEQAIWTVSDSELYDLAAEMFAAVHQRGEDYVEKMVKAIDQMELPLGGDAAMSAFNVRGKILNPSGLTVARAQEVIDQQRTRLGPAAFAAVEKAADEMRELMFDAQQAAYNEGLISSRAWNEIVLPNRDNYVPYAVLEHWEGRVTAGMKNQKGTVKDIADIVVAIPMKVRSLNLWRQSQRQVVLLTSIYKKGNVPFTVSERPMQKASDIHAIHVKKKDDVSRSVLYINGAPHLAEFPNDPGQTLQHAMAQAGFLSELEYLAKAGDLIAGLMQAYTTLNPQFIGWRNPVRGAFTALARFGMGAVKATPYMRQARRLASTYAHAAYGGELTPELRRLIAEGVVQPPRLAAAMFGDPDMMKMALAAGEILSTQLQDGMLTKKWPWWKAGSFGRATYNWFMRTSVAYEAFEKIMHHQSALKSGYTRQRSAAMARRGGIPLQGQGGKFSQPTEVFFPWARVHVQGLRITNEMMQDPEMGRSFAMRFLLFSIIPRMITWSIGTGLVLKGVEYLIGPPDDDEPEWKRELRERLSVRAEALRRISPYKLAIDNVIPLYFYDPSNGSYHSLSEFRSGAEIPIRYEVVSLRVPDSEEGRLWGAMFFSMLSSFEGPEGGVGKAGGGLTKNFYEWFSSQMLPSIAPPITIGLNTLDLMFSESIPRDKLRGTPVVNETLFNAGGTDRAQAVAGYVLSQTGGPGELALIALQASGVIDARAGSTMTKRLYTDKTPLPERTPVVKGMFSYDNYAPYRDIVEGREDDKKEKARARMILPNEHRSMLDVYYRYLPLDKRATLDAKGKVQWEVAKMWVTKVWGKRNQEGLFYNRAVYATSDTASAQSKETFLRDLTAGSMYFVTAFENPETLMEYNKEGGSK